MDVHAFLSSCGVGMFPHLVFSQPNPETSLNILNAASSEKTLRIMLLLSEVCHEIGPQMITD